MPAVGLKLAEIDDDSEVTTVIVTTEGFPFLSFPVDTGPGSKLKQIYFVRAACAAHGAASRAQPRRKRRDERVWFMCVFCSKKLLSTRASAGLDPKRMGIRATSTRVGVQHRPRCRSTFACAGVSPSTEPRVGLG